MDDLLWYLEITLDYIKQMLPCMAIAAGCFLALLHHRRRGLYRRGLQSGVVREIGLFVFVLFCAGLAALTVFPSNFWTLYHWQAAFRGEQAFFPITPLSESVQYIGWTPYFLDSFQTIGSWTFYMAAANALIFVPIGFFANLLWRKPRWWKGLAVGFWSGREEIRALRQTDRLYQPDMTDKTRERLLRGWHKAVGRSLNWAEPQD